MAAFFFMVMESINYLVIEGNIGAGKTSLARKIAEEKNARLILEHFDDNPFLPKFYKEPDKYSFQVELSFLAERYNQLKGELSNRDLFQPFTLADYYFTKSLIFAGATLKHDEYQLYRKLFNIIYNSLPKPDLYVYLHLNIEQLLENIKKRGRDYESDITPEYLLTIQKGYFEFFKQENDIPIVMIDTENLDFVENQTDYKLLKRTIFETKYDPGIHRIVL